VWKLKKFAQERKLTTARTGRQMEVYESVDKFKGRRENVFDFAHSGRPSTVTYVEVKE
jgi:hypothetical protein